MMREKENKNENEILDDGMSRVTPGHRSMSRRKVLTYLGAAGAATVAGALLNSRTGFTQPENSVTGSVYGKGNAEGIHRAAEEVVREYAQEHELKHRILETSLTSLETSLADIAISVKSVGATGDGVTDDTQAFQDAINLAVSSGILRVVVPAGNYVLTSSIVIDANVCLIGNRTSSILDFTQLADGFALVVGQTKAITGIRIEGLTLRGNRNCGGIILNSSKNIGRAVVDSSFVDMLVHNFKIGIETMFVWSNYFESIRFQGCTTSANLYSQTNNSIFSRVSFVTAEKVLTLINCEGLHFDSCDMSNVTGTIAITLYQSQVVITNPYFENIRDVLIFLGSINEVTKSACMIRGGIVSGHIQIANSQNLVKMDDVRNTAVNLFRNEVSSPRLFIPEGKLSYLGTRASMPKKVIVWFGNTPIPFSASFNGQTVTSHPTNQNYAIVSATQGIRIASTLEIGKQYVLSLQVRKNTNASLGIRHVASLGTAVATEPNEGFELRHIPFVAEAALLNLEWLGDLDIAMISLYEGFYLPQPSAGSKMLFATTPPVKAKWNQGDIVYNSNVASGGTVGWACTASGTPGTWKPFGTVS
jgi:hypothetical protein